MNFLFLDTETTGFTHNRLVQLAYEHHPTGERRVEHFKPPVPIEDGAAKVHGKTNDMAESWPTFAGSKYELHLPKLLKENILVCHNAKYDIGVLQNEGIEVGQYICTMEVARAVLPTATNHKLQTLRTEIGFDVPEGDLTAHDAMGDVLVMIGLFAYMWRIEQNKGLFGEEVAKRWVSISSGIPEKMPFGRHRGVPIAQLPTEYVAWILQEKDFDPRVIAAIKHYLPHLV